MSEPRRVPAAVLAGAALGSPCCRSFPFATPSVPCAGIDPAVGARLVRHRTTSVVRPQDTAPPVLAPDVAGVLLGPVTVARLLGDLGDLGRDDG